MSKKSNGKNERGQILPLMALFFLAIIALVGVTLDVGRVVSERTKLVRAVDAAALAGALKLPDATAANTAATAYMTENEATATIQFPGSSTNTQIQVKGQKNVNLLFGKIMQLLPGTDGLTSWTITANATAGYGIVPLDAYMAIDDTGSMSGSPITNAKQAATNFTNTLLGSGASSVTKVGAGGARGCYNPPRTGVSGCESVSTKVRNLTTSASSVISTINNLDGGGGSGTNVCLALHKGNEVLFGTGSQSGSNVIKVLVLLSDGDNNYDSNTYSSSQGSPPTACTPTNPTSEDSTGDCSSSAGSHEKSLDTKTKAFADSIKATGVQVYVVGFGVCGTNNTSQTATSSYCANIGNNDGDGTADRRLLKCIASSSSGTNDHYFEASSASALPNIFTQIAQQLAFRLIS